jgi:hypothetical protein
MTASLVNANQVCSGPPQDGPSAQVTWYRKFYGSTQFVFWQTTMTDDEVTSDGIRCPENPPHYTWQTTYKAEVLYGGQTYTATVTYGGPQAEYYNCCPGANCYPWFPCPD